MLRRVRRDHPAIAGRRRIDVVRRLAAPAVGDDDVMLRARAHLELQVRGVVGRALGDLALVLAVDTSASMTAAEQRAQREGYIEAFRNPAIAEAAATGEIGQIAVTFVEWAGAGQQRIVLPWRVIAGGADAASFADALTETGIGRGSGTSISWALQFAAGLFQQVPQSDRKVIDISGDGMNNAGPALAEVRKTLFAEGITINGLPIALSNSYEGQTGDHQDADIANYFENCVAGGTDAFVLSIKNMREFETSIRMKLTREIAGGLGDPAQLLLHASFTPDPCRPPGRTVEQRP